MIMIDFFTDAQTLFDYTRNLRRDIHRNPELGLKEVRTAEIVARELRALDLTVTTGVAETGVVALMDSGQPGPVVLVRFDMDALPINEETGLEYASQIPGVMHACGHDGHTAIGLTVAKLLYAHLSQLTGKIKFVFQPGEEGLDGAKRMIADGILENPKPDVALALHLWNEEQIGWLGIKPGPLMAASDTFHIRVLGRGGHAAAPNFAKDPILASTQIIMALQSIVTRDISPLDSAVISVTSLHGGEAMGVIPSEVEIMGTIRTFISTTRDLIFERIRQVATGVGEGMGCQLEITFTSIAPAVINDALITRRVQEVASRTLPESTIDPKVRSTVSDDMAYIMKEIPGCYFLVGSANAQKGLSAGHHHPRFEFDEQILPQAVALMAAAVAEFLGG
jgi:amidohydrolase